MRNFDLTPFLRSSVGFDRFDQLFDTVQGLDRQFDPYPPYNIIRQGEDAYEITMAVAGFGEDDLDIVVHEDVLSVKGELKDRAEDDGEDVVYLHRGIAGRAFERRFRLDDTIKVADGRLENGLLKIKLVREIPEHRKPRRIEIGSKTLDHQDAA